MFETHRKLKSIFGGCHTAVHVHVQSTEEAYRMHRQLSAEGCHPQQMGPGESFALDNIEVCLFSPDGWAAIERPDTSPIPMEVDNG